MDYWTLTTINGTKTSGGRRRLPLPERVISDLRKMQWGKSRDDMVFTDDTGGYSDHRLITRRHLKPFLKKTGLPDISLYSLRHSCATLLLANNENPKVVSERLGHSNVMLTLDTYSHVLPTKQDNATKKLESLLDRAH